MYDPRSTTKYPGFASKKNHTCKCMSVFPRQIFRSSRLIPLYVSLAVKKKKLNTKIKPYSYTYNLTCDLF